MKRLAEYEKSPTTEQFASVSPYVKPKLDFLRSAMEMVVAELQQRLRNRDQSGGTDASPCPFLGLEQT
jgi:hypothetical protein